VRSPAGAKVCCGDLFRPKKGAWGETKYQEMQLVILTVQLLNSILTHRNFVYLPIQPRSLHGQRIVTYD
jgi:hypothetical protein